MSQDEGTEITHQSEQADTNSSYPKWTIMVYLAGDNNLSANSLSVLQQLEAASLIRGGEVRVIACFDANTPRPRGARYMEIKHGRFENPPHPKTSWGLHNDLVPFCELQEAGIQPVVSPNFCDFPCEPAPTELPDVQGGLSRFLKFVLKFHRAERYMLILYGHGTAVAGNTFLADDNPPSFLRLKDFAEVLREHFDVRDDEEQRADWEESQAGGGSGSESGYCYKPALDILACDNCIMNGIEASYEVRRQVKYILGSQGLALAVGWPFRKIVNAVVRHRTRHTARVAQSLLRVCARNLIDFALMDRSSEQSVCDLTKLRRPKNLVTAVRGLSEAMQEGLRLITAADKNAEKPEEEPPNPYRYKEIGDVRYPAVRDAIKLARLEAQSYWSEVFVDLYDFCKLLLDRCNDHLNQFYVYVVEINLQLEDRLLKANDSGLKAAAIDLDGLSTTLRGLDVMRIFYEIAKWCRAVMREIQVRKFVLRSYYIGPDLQYSNGVSVYFPWNLPERPIIFEPADKKGRCAPAGSYGISWSSLNKFKDDVPKLYTVKTAFDEYKTYKFARPSGGDWANFLVRFYKATLRNVRRFDFEYVDPATQKSKREDAGFLFFEPRHLPLTGGDRFVDLNPIDLQKSGSDNDSEEDCTCPTIKNYPRRFYISPADCKRSCPVPNEGTKEEKVKQNVCHEREAVEVRKQDDSDDTVMEPCVSYLGWNIRGLVAQVINLKEDRREDLDARFLAETDELEADGSDSDETEADESEDDDLDSEEGDETEE